jgi:hypothetical protein
VGNREHPLPHRDIGWEDVLHQVRRALGHPSAAAVRTEAAALAAERHEPLERAVAAAHTGEAMSEDPTAKELPELVGDERRQANTVGTLAYYRREIVPVPTDDTVEHARRRRARDVDAAHGVGAERMECQPKLPGTYRRSVSFVSSGIVLLPGLSSWVARHHA